MAFPLDVFIAASKATDAVGLLVEILFALRAVSSTGKGFNVSRAGTAPIWRFIVDISIPCTYFMGH